MNVQEEVQTALKDNKAILGYRRSIKFIKLNSPKLIVVSNNLPEKVRKEIDHNAKVSGAKVETFNGTSKELGIICSKPFPVSTLVIKG
ncbi:MAG: 50S ribosomal protein L30e [Candidatus Aenigmarchaeota archaeon]|nr:50S ribosomal protein L30e [Candidatus Aenigmarchaeota archaeon]